MFFPYEIESRRIGRAQNIQIRRGNFRLMSVALHKLSNLFYGLNMTTYMDINIRYENMLKQAPPEVMQFVSDNIMCSQSGHQSKAEGGDFILESVNKKIKTAMPSGLPTEDRWLRVCRNLPFIEKLKKQLENKLGQPEDQSGNTYFRQINKEEAVNELEKKLETYLQEDQLKSIDGKPLDHELTEFDDKCENNKRKYYETYLTGINKNIERVFVTPDDRANFFDISKKRNTEIQECIEGLIQNIEEEGGFEESEVLHKQYMKEIKGAAKKVLLSFYREVVQCLEEVSSREIEERVYSTVQFSLLESLRCHSTDEYLVYGVEEENSVPPLACSFSRVPSSAHLLALVDENGSLVIYDTNRYGEKALLKDWNAHSNAVFDLAWMSKEEKILTGSGDQTICLWDAKTAKKLLTFKGHTSSVRSVVFRPQDDAVFASGSRDGHVRLWDHRCNIKDDQVSSVNVIKNAHAMPQQTGGKRRKSRACPAQPLDSQQSVTSVVFQDDNLLATAGAVDGVIKVWDLRKVKSTTTDPTALYSFPYPGKSKRTHGYSSLVFDSTCSRLFASCTDDIIYMYDFASYNTTPVCSFRGHRNTSFYVKAVVSPDNQFLLSGSSDEHAYIWQIDKPHQSPVLLKGHRSEVSDVAWCQKDLFRIVTASDDNTMRIWRFDPTAMMRKASGQTDISCGITGTAERTHRDIGTGVSSQSSQDRKSEPRSPIPGQKRASSETPQPDLTPKRAKTFPSCSSSAVSPSIKQWLKRNASDTVTASAESQTKRLKSTETENEAKIEKEVTRLEERVSENAENISKISYTSAEQVSRSQEVLEQRSVGKPSCKRKLNENDDERPTKRINVRKSPMKENKISRSEIPACSKETETKESTNRTISSAKHSPAKKSPLKNLSSDINSSPDKRVQTGELEFYSPARPRNLEIDPKTLSSPTSNLPNLVMDSPVSSKKVSNKENEDKTTKIDWLTQMRMQKLGKQNMGTKSCSRKLSDKYVQNTETVSRSKESQQSQGGSDDIPRCKSPVAGVKSIKSFFKRQASA